MRKSMRCVVMLIMVVLFAGSISAQDGPSPDYEVTDEYGGELVAVSISGDETILVVALPFRVEFYDLTSDDLPLVDSLDLPDINGIAIKGSELAIIHRGQPDSPQQISLYDVETRQQISGPSQWATIESIAELASADGDPDDAVLAAIDTAAQAAGHKANRYQITAHSENIAVLLYRVIPEGEMGIYLAFRDALDVVNLRTQQITTLNRVFTSASGALLEVTDTTAVVSGSCGWLTIDFSAAPIEGVFESGCGEVYDQLCGAISTGFIVESEFCYYEPGPVLEGTATINIRRLDSSGEAFGETLTLEGHTDWINGFIFLPDGQRLLTWGQDRSIILWTFVDETGALEQMDQQVFRLDSVPSDVDIDIAGNLMAVGDRSGHVSLYDIDPTSAAYGTVVQTLDSLSSSPDVRFSTHFLYTLSGGRVVRWQIRE